MTAAFSTLSWYIMIRCPKRSHASVLNLTPGFVIHASSGAVGAVGVGAVDVGAVGTVGIGTVAAGVGTVGTGTVAAGVGTVGTGTVAAGVGTVGTVAGSLGPFGFWMGRSVAYQPLVVARCAAHSRAVPNPRERKPLWVALHGFLAAALRGSCITYLYPDLDREDNGKHNPLNTCVVIIFFGFCNFATQKKLCNLCMQLRDFCHIRRLPFAKKG